MFDATWRFDHVYDSYTVPRRYGTHTMKTGRVAAVAEEARRRWQAEGRAPADAFWVRNRRNTGLVLVSPNSDLDASKRGQVHGIDVISGSDGKRTVLGQAVAQQSPPATSVPGRVTTLPASSQRLFELYRQRLAPIEGGFANRSASADPGGRTNKGLSQSLLDLLLKKPQYKHYPSDTALLSDSQIDFIFREEFFRRLRVWELAQIPNLLQQAPQLPEQIFDSGIQHGIDNIGKWLQEALDETLGTDLRTVVNGKLEYDGIIGSGTRKVVEQAVKAGKIAEVNDLIVDKRVAYMRSLPNAGSNPGWFPRAEAFRIVQTTP